MASPRPNHVESLVGHFRAAVLGASLPLSGVSKLGAIMAMNGRPSLLLGRFSSVPDFLPFPSDPP